MRGKNNQVFGKKIPKFYLRVYDVVKRIPKGRVSTYKLVARALHSKAYRAVGNALNKNPFKFVPCHRVVKSDGSIGGFARGTNEKERLLKEEGVEIINNKIKNFEKHLFHFDRP